ncbi:unnamed protein product [Brugia timori]|uniref:Uncharacterized protein n=1 Tax=Brugia timori TaxID=42155 RepID=A0A3P7XQ76_9BILA|nr:unnamed protein product [Brugia timori]
MDRLDGTTQRSLLCIRDSKSQYSTYISAFPVLFLLSLRWVK